MAWALVELGLFPESNQGQFSDKRAIIIGPQRHNTVTLENNTFKATAKSALNEHRPRKLLLEQANSWRLKNNNSQSLDRYTLSIEYKSAQFTRTYKLWVGSRGGVGLAQRTISQFLPLLFSPSKEQVNNVHIVQSSLWRGTANIHGFFLEGKSYLREWATAQTLNTPVILSVRITTPLLCSCNLESCHQWG